MNEKKSYAVVGHPVSHSLSPDIHILFANQAGLSITYTAIDVEENHFEPFINQFFQSGSGLNVTLPFKNKAWHMADHLDDHALHAEAVNTLWINSEGKLAGSNTDGKGLINDITNNLDFSLKNKRILIIGAGGAVHGVMKPILDENPESVTIINRTMERAKKLADKYSSQYPVSTDFDHRFSSFDLIINGSVSGIPAWLSRESEKKITGSTMIYDMNYGQRAKLFSSWAISLGAKNVYDGLGMLVEQAAESFKIWHGVKPETKPVITNIRNS